MDVITSYSIHYTKLYDYKIPLATFANANGLEAKTGTVYAASVESGSATLNEADTGSTGGIMSGELESSTVDTATEFSSLIVVITSYSIHYTKLYDSTAFSRRPIISATSAAVKLSW